MVRTTSTSFINGTGLKKCRPTKRSGRLVEVSSSVIEIEDVFEAKIASFFTMPSSAAYIFFFSSTFSITASTMMSHPARSSILVVPFNLARTDCGVSLSPPFSANLASDFSMPAKPLSRYFCSTSRTVTSNPAVAATCAMPDPIRPQPRTPTFLMSMTFLFNHGGHGDHGDVLPLCTQCPPWFKNLVHALHDHRNPLPTANARRRQPVLLLSAAQFV